MTPAVFWQPQPLTLTLLCLPYRAEEVFCLLWRSLHGGEGLPTERNSKGQTEQYGSTWFSCSTSHSAAPHPSPFLAMQEVSKVMKILNPSAFHFFNRGKGDLGGWGVLSVSKAQPHVLTGRTHPASKDNSLLVLGSTTSLSHRKGIWRSQGAHYCPTIFSQEETLTWRMEGTLHGRPCWEAGHIQ